MSSYVVGVPEEYEGQALPGSIHPSIANAFPTGVPEINKNQLYTGISGYLDQERGKLRDHVKDREKLCTQKKVVIIATMLVLGLIGTYIFIHSATIPQSKPEEYEIEDCINATAFNLTLPDLPLLPQYPTGVCPPNCRLPNCRCPDDPTIPNGMPFHETPQFVYISFNDHISKTWDPIMWDGVHQIIDRVNPNGCKTRSTFFITNPGTQYEALKLIHDEGHEIAGHSFSHEDLSEATGERYIQEIYAYKRCLAEFTNIYQYIGSRRFMEEEIKGYRAPLLLTGGDIMYTMLWNDNFLYDASMIPKPEVPNNWPYTLDTLPGNVFCSRGPACPSRSFPGLWEVPTGIHFSSNGAPCNMLDSCFPQSYGEMLNYLFTNFLAQYCEVANRPPFQLSVHWSYFTDDVGKERLRAVKDFLNELQNPEAGFYPTVHVAAIEDIIAWMKDPVPLSIMNSDGCNPMPKKAENARDPCKEWREYMYGEGGEGEAEINPDDLAK